MPRIEFDNVAKSFGDTEVLRQFSVTVDDGEFLVLLGPSGCGKSTLLRMVAGLTNVSSGQIGFDGEIVNDWDVRRRNIAFVFQSYALYPQMTVKQNIAFPLIMDQLRPWQHLPIIGSIVRHRLMKTPAISEKIDRIAGQLGLTPLLNRRPAALSGGQRQRVALARSLVREPSMYLLDEPLSNLDAKLRTQMRSDITALHRAVGKTFIYVTHDQVEAMTMATKIVVMDRGLIQQVGTPDDIYDRPHNTFVATFVGSPPMNLIDGQILRAHRSVVTSGEGPPDDTLPDVLAGVRPENLRIEPAESGGIPADIETVERLGAETLLGCRLLESTGADSPAPLVFARTHRAHALRTGERCSVHVDPGSLSWFDKSSGQRLENHVWQASIAVSGTVPMKGVAHA